MAAPLLRKSDLLKEYDLFVCSAGFEDRTVSAIEKAAQTIRVKKSLINLYSIPDENLFSKNKENLEKIKSILARISKAEPIVVHNDPSRVENFYWSLEEHLSRSTSTLIDITSFTRLFLYTTLYLLQSKKAVTHVLYTEPAEYTMNYSRGLEKIIIHPYMPGIPDQSKKILMVMFLGWEIQRAESVMEEFEPDKLITIIETSKDRRRKKWNEITAIECRNLMRMSNTLRVPALRPDAIVKKLESLYSKLSREYDFCILNIGPKIHCLGIAEFASRHDDVQVLYPKPYSWTMNPGHEDESPPVSAGIGRTYFFELENFENKVGMK